MSNIAEFSYAGLNVFVSPLLPIDEVEYSDELNEFGERTGHLTGRKTHAIYLKAEYKMLVSQELYDKMKDYFKPANQ